MNISSPLRRRPANNTLNTSNHSESEEESKAALAHHACIDALKVLSAYLKKEMGIRLEVRDTEDVLRTLQRAHDYCQRLNASPETFILLLSCWKSVYTYTAMVHSTSWRNFQQRKHFAAGTGAATLATTIQYAEDCSTCQRQLLLLQRKWGEQQALGCVEED